MKKYLLIFLLLSFAYWAEAQKPRLYTIGQTGCTFYSYCENFNIEKTLSEDGSSVYTGECVFNSVSYGIVCVQLLVPISTDSAAISVVKAYVEYLRSELKIKAVTDQRSGFRLENDLSSIGSAENWRDDTDNQWNVKTWTNKKVIAVLYSYDRETPPIFETESFQNSFRFK